MHDTYIPSHFLHRFFLGPHVNFSLIGNQWMRLAIVFLDIASGVQVKLPEGYTAWKFHWTVQSAPCGRF